MPEQDPIERAFFREAEDGATVFFPWGLSRRGYRLSGEADKKSASRAASLLVMSPIAIGTWIAHALHSTFESEAAGVDELAAALVGPLAILFCVILGYSLWAWRFIERFPESDLRVTREERLREAALEVKPWQVALFGVAVACLSVFCSWLEPRAWWLGVLGVALGVGALYWSVCLKRAASGAAVRRPESG